MYKVVDTNKTSDDNRLVAGWVHSNYMLLKSETAFLSFRQKCWYPVPQTVQQE